MTSDAFRCAAAAEQRYEPLSGTASLVWNWMLLEQPGSWGRDALMESRLPKDLAARLRAKARAAGVRVVLIRRGVRMASAERQVYFAHTSEAASCLSHMSVGNLDDLMDVDLTVLKEGGVPEGAAERREPTFLVCTHGRHDACCSIRGNQISRVVCALPGVDAWESSHIGGDRFAANMVCFPHGIYYGRVMPGDVERLVTLYGRGELSLEHLRGRSCYSFAMQAAEGFVREQSGLLGVSDLTLLSREESLRKLRARFSLIDGRSAEVEVRIRESAEPQRLTCGARSENQIPIYELVDCSLNAAS